MDSKNNSSGHEKDLKETIQASSEKLPLKNDLKEKTKTENVDTGIEMQSQWETNGETKNSKLDLNDLSNLNHPKVCGINKEPKLDLNKLSGVERPEVCGIENSPKIDLNNLPEVDHPEVCGIQKEPKLDLDELPEAAHPEVCGIQKEPKLDLDELPGTERPEVCGIQKEPKLDLNGLPGTEHPEVCGIQKEPKLDLGGLPGAQHPNVCSIDTTPVTDSLQKESKPGIKDTHSGRSNEIITDTYGVNIPVSEETRKKLLAELKENAQNFSSPIKESHTSLQEGIITIVKNGPYLVRGEIPIKDTAIKTDQIGQSIGWKDTKDVEEPKKPTTVALCRCGHSKHMPFCDGTHESIDFDGECTASNTPYDEAAAIYEGCPGVYLMDEESLCAIVRFCDPDGSCWNLVKSDETVDIAKAQTFNCASGRLTIIENGKKLEPKLDKEIECIVDTERDVLGPLWVKGGIPVVNGQTHYEVRNRVTLCRCGRSENKPFCDGMHLTCPHLTKKEFEENA